MVLFAGVDTFNNAGTIRSADFDASCGCGNNFGAYIGGAVTSFANSGVISGYNGGALFTSFESLPPDIGSIINSGRITGSNGSGLLITDFDDEFTTASPASIGSLANSAGGAIEGQYYGALINNSTPISISNAGTITGWGDDPYVFTLYGHTPPGLNLAGASVGLQFNANPDTSTLTNSGTITGDTGVNVIVGEDDEVKIVNSGSIVGTNGTGIEFSVPNLISSVPDPEDDPTDPFIETSGLISGSVLSIDFTNANLNTLKIDTGAKFIGTVQFGGIGSMNTVDFSDYHGNMLFSYYGGGGPLVPVTGSNLNAWDIPDGTIGIVDGTSIIDAAQPVEDLVGAIQDSAHDALNGTPSPVGDGFVANYLPQRPMTAAARAATAVAMPAPSGGTTLWGNVFGGGDTNGTGAGTNTQFGGLVVGAQSEFMPGLTLGVLASYGRTSFNIVHGQQTITADTGAFGIYGATKYADIGLDFSLLAGFGSNQSSRTITTMTGDEIGTASFGSWFIAPEIGASMPVMRVGNQVFNLAGQLDYIAGGFGGYTESGSAADITVGSETIGILDAKAEINTKMVVNTPRFGDVTLSGKFGVFSQINVGGSTVPVTVLGLAAGNAEGNGATGVGMYAGAGAEMPVSAGFVLGANVSGSARSDGTFGGTGMLRIGGKY